MQRKLQTSQGLSVKKITKSFFGFFSKGNKVIYIGSLSLPPFIPSPSTLSVDITNTCLHDKKALYDAAQRGDVSTVRQLMSMSTVHHIGYGYIVTHDYYYELISFMDSTFLRSM